MKKMAAFQCCRCREIGIDIHHIIPQADGGSDDIENAAPLCQNCHSRFGANPEKRKEIRQMRDWWYEVVKEKYHGDQGQLEKFNETILNIQRAQEGNQAELSKLRNDLIEEVKAIRRFQEREAEKLDHVPIANLPSQANSSVSATVTIVEIPHHGRGVAGSSTS